LVRNGYAQTGTLLKYYVILDRVSPDNFPIWALSTHYCCTYAYVRTQVLLFLTGARKKYSIDCVRLDDGRTTRTGRVGSHDDVSGVLRLSVAMSPRLRRFVSPNRFRWIPSRAVVLTPVARRLHAQYYRIIAHKRDTEP